LHKIDIKPLSVNQAWQGRLRKTNQLKKYIRDISYLLPVIDVPEDKIKLTIEWGFSSIASDIDNPLKPFLDCLEDKYGFNDKMIYELIVRKNKVKRGNEYILFDIERLIGD
jgi:Holliday junction resolvase RusA-like endonuclease